MLNSCLMISINEPRTSICHMLSCPLVYQTSDYEIHTHHKTRGITCPITSGVVRNGNFLASDKGVLRVSSVCKIFLAV